MDEPTQESTGASGISRRTIVKGAAWSVPVVMMAKVPAFATSHAGTPPPVIITLAGGACKLPGNATDEAKGNAFGLTIDNDTAGFDVEVEITAMRVGGTNRDIIQIVIWEENGGDSCTAVAYPGGTISVDDGESVDIAVFTADAPNSPSTTLEIDYTWSGSGGSFDETADTSFVGSPWTGGCRPWGPDPKHNSRWDNASGCPTFSGG